ncbi:MAG: hypothetical protein HND42_10840 [Armatimonadetes bacterium]|nr:hypothetical protein [Armatimonadota bacterium]NOG93724.1 hypothetical protein [Armatimonadota bacterium]
MILSAIGVLLAQPVWIQASDEVHVRLVPQTGHSSPIGTIEFSANGSQIMTASPGDRVVRIWDLMSGREIRRIGGGLHPVESAALLQDGFQVITTGQDVGIRIWDCATGKEVRSRVLKQFISIPKVMSVSPDQQRFASVYAHGAEVWNLRGGYKLLGLDGHTGEVVDASFSPDGLQIVTASMDTTARVWNAATGRQLLVLANHTDGVTSAEFSPDGSRIVTASLDGKVCVWDAKSGEMLNVMKGHTGWVNDAEYSPNGNLIASVSSDGDVRIWKSSTGRILKVLSGGGGGLASLSFSHDGERIAAGRFDGSAVVWNTSTWEELVALGGIALPPVGAQFSSIGRCIYTSHSRDDRSSVYVWDLPSGRVVKVLAGVTATVPAPSSRYFLLAESFRFHVADARTRATIATIVPGGVISAPTLAAGASRIAFLHQRSVQVVAVPTGEVLCRLSGDFDYFTHAAISPDGLRVVTWSEEDVRVWDATVGDSFVVLRGHTSWVKSACFSPDSERVLTASIDRSARVWDARTGAELQTITDDLFFNRAYFSHDGTQIIGVMDSGVVRTWNATTGETIPNPLLHGSSAKTADVSEDGVWVATTSDDFTTRIWDRGTGKEMCRLISFGDGGWAVATPDGHFDTDRLEEVKRLHWIASDQPFTPLGIEVFMRQYYEPKLLARILRGEKLPEVNNILDLNRVQPLVDILEVKEKIGSAMAKVTVKVAKATGTFERDGKEVVVETSAHDLRLFRDGRLVKHVEGELIHEGQVSQTFVFDDVPIPNIQEKREIRFTAYCFNDDDVKSETAAYILDVPPSAVVRKPRVFAICIGADDYDGDAVRDLKYAAADAKAFQKTFMSAFTNHAGIEQVVSLSFVSESEGAKQATKENFKVALDLLCGRQVSSEVLERAPDLKKLSKATPDDIVIVTFSGHGVSGDDGKFYLVPSNIKSKETLREDSISSDELSDWFRDLDALEMAFILDACHSAKAIEQEGFKPGPMGARGLGQLAYDKGMLVLAATQAEDVALEVNKLQHGLLTYALVEDGYIAGKAKDDQGLLTLQGWLKYAESRVPEIYAALATGEDIRGEDGRAVIFSGSTASMKTREDLQRPSLFDFLKTRPQIEMVQATTGDVWTPIWGLFVNNASVLSDGAAFDEAVVEFLRRVVMSSIAWSRRSA